MTWVNEEGLAMTSLNWGNFFGSNSVFRYVIPAQEGLARLLRCARNDMGK